MRNWLRLVRAYLAWRAVFAGAMMDLTQVSKLLTSILHGTAWPTLPTALQLRLYTVTGSGTAAGTEATVGNCAPYVAGTGLAMALWAIVAGTTALGQGPIAAVSITATMGWAPITAIEIWDTSPLRWFWGPLSGGAVTVNNGNTLQFAINSIQLTATGF